MMSLQTGNKCSLFYRKYQGNLRTLRFNTKNCYVVWEPLFFPQISEHICNTDYAYKTNLPV